MEFIKRIIKFAAILPCMVVLVNSCKSQDDNGLINNSTYSVAAIPELNNFLTFNKNEKRLDSLNSRYDRRMDSLVLADTTKKKFLKKKDFKNNRSRIFMDSYTNGKLTDVGPNPNIGFPTPCECYTTHDSVFVKMGVGFFGGIGFNIKISGNHFLSSFFNYTDDVKPFKSDLKDTAFYDYAIAKSKYQYLILDQKPDYKPGQQLTGYLTYTTNDYYEKAYGDALDSIYVKGKIYFTCKTRYKTEWDK